MLTKSIAPVGKLSDRDLAAATTNVCKPDQVSAMCAKYYGEGGENMLTVAIDPAGSLSERELSIIKAKLRNLDGISAVPVDVEKNELRIGIDDNAFVDDWEFIGRKLGYRVHSV